MKKIKSPKKLIEVALPLDDINRESAREKSIRQGHPSTLHLWWARRPLASARAVLFAQLVNDPGYERNLGRGVNKLEAQKKREKLFDILRRLVSWDNINDEKLLKEANDEILKSWNETRLLNKDHPNYSEIFSSESPPSFLDPFAGGGAIPLEALRLGLNSYASDLNPVAVTINKSMIELLTSLNSKLFNNTLRNQGELISNSTIRDFIARETEFYGDLVIKNARKKSVISLEV